MEQKIASLGGHSGCGIFLYKDDLGDFFVRKYSAVRGYNSRLMEQMRKQKDFKSGILKAPAVISSGYKEDIFYFDMEYIHGITLAEYIKTIDVNQICILVDTLLSNIKEQTRSKDHKSKVLFGDKVKDLRDKLYGKRTILDKGLDYLEGKDWSGFERSFCHGDMTFENIIVSGKDLYLIDFLDSFYDSWILDIASLLQDSHCMWAYRKEDEINVNTRLRLLIFKNLLLDKMEVSGYNIKKEIYCALLLKLIRIYPYTKEADILDILDYNLMMVLTDLQDMEV